jgi:uncharacterized protein YacL
MEEINVKIFDKDYPDVKDVDKKLLLLGKDLQASVA